MKTPLEPYVIEFLRSKGYKYFLPETITCHNEVPAVLLKPCKNKPAEGGSKVKNAYIPIEKRDYIATKKGHKEWMWTNIPNEELPELRRSQLSYYARQQPKPTE